LGPSAAAGLACSPAAQVDHPMPEAPGNATCGFFPLNPFFPFGADPMSRERVSSGCLTVLNGSVGVCQIRLDLLGSFANLDVFAESAESRLQFARAGRRAGEPVPHSGRFRG
jgi:hypothetical protein